MKDLRFNAHKDESILRSVIDSALDAVIIIDQEGMIHEWNDQATKSFGWTREEALNLRISDTIVPHRFREAHEKGLRHFLSTGEGPVLNKRIEIVAMNKHGDEFPVELTIIPNKVDNQYFFSSFVRDITDRKKAEEELKNALESERSYNELNRNFVSMVSHEFRTPLTSIQSTAELIHDYIDKFNSEDIKKRVKRILESSIRMDRLIEDVLTIGKLDTMHQMINVTDVEMEEMLEDMIEELTVGVLKERVLEIRGLQPGFKVQTDSSLLELILKNLIGNAVKYSHPDTKLTLDISSTDDALILSVTDKGIGIPENELDQIFESFTRASNTEGVAGNGLGLSIVKKSVEKLKGHISVDTELNKGTTVTIELPHLAVPPAESY